MCVLRNLLEVHMYLNEYNKVKSTAGYDVGVTDMIKIHQLNLLSMIEQLSN